MTTPRPERSRPPRPAAAAHGAARPTRSQASQPQRQGRLPQARPRPVQAVYAGATAKMTTPGGQSRSARPTPPRPAHPQQAAATRGATGRRTRSQADRRGRSGQPQVRPLRTPRVACSSLAAKTTPGSRSRMVEPTLDRPVRRRAVPIYGDAPSRTRPQEARPRLAASRVDRRGRSRLPRVRRLVGAGCGGALAKMASPRRLGAGPVAPRVRLRLLRVRLPRLVCGGVMARTRNLGRTR
jgi:hypothetical protein